MEGTVGSISIEEAVHGEAVPGCRQAQLLPCPGETQSMSKQVCSVGRTALCYDQWTDITNDPFVLQSVRGIQLKFTSPSLEGYPRDIPMSGADQALVDAEIEKLLLKGAILPVDPVPGQFVSNIFVTPKNQGVCVPL